MKPELRGILTRSPRHRAAEVWCIRANPGAAARPASQCGELGRALAGPASAPVLAPGSALGLLLSRALSSVQANGDCRCALARRQSPVEVVSFGQTRQRPMMRSCRAHLRSLPTWFLAETK